MPQLVFARLGAGGLAPRRSIIGSTGRGWLSRSVPANDSVLRLRQGNHFRVQALVEELKVLRLLDLVGT